MAEFFSVLTAKRFFISAESSGTGFHLKDNRNRFIEKAPIIPFSKKTCT